METSCQMDTSTSIQTMSGTHNSCHNLAVDGCGSTRVSWPSSAPYTILIQLSANLAVAKAEQAHLRSVPSNNGVSKLLDSIRENKIPRNEVFTNTSLLHSFLDEDFTRDVYPIPAHSHNDYLRNIPLYDALQAGCASVEADIWVDPNNSTNLLVGHTRNSLNPAKTLTDMYVTPIISILDTMNQDNDGTLSGPFTTSPNTTLVLLLDFKMSADVLWPLVQTHLAPFREKGYLQYWNETTQKVTFGPVTIVASGLADKQPQLVLSSSTNPLHDIFLDAPLLTLPSMADASATYNISNSYYASTSLNPALKTNSFMPSLLTRPQGYDVFSSSQIATLRNQTNVAQSIGLKARYWDTPGWPIGTRNAVWQGLVKQVGVDVLNVDDVWGAARWDWDWCLVGWIGIC